MTRRWVLWWLCIILALGSAVGGWATSETRSDDLRGWVDATTTQDLPQKLPLAGVNVELTQYAPDQLASELTRIAAAGFTWVRQPFLWSDIEPVQGEFAWSAYDALVEAVAQVPQLQLVAVLDGSPGWARHALAPEHPFAPPASVVQYAAFAGAVAERYAETLEFYQVWDEPNITSHWGNLDPRPAHYAAMLKEAYRAIHAADSSATVIAAALAPTVEEGPDNLSDVLYLRALYEQGAREYFDAAAGKPYGFNTGPYDRRVDARILNFSRVILLREEMVRRGDADKPLWGSNFGWNTLPDNWSGPPSIWGSVTSDQQERYIRDAFERARNEWPWMGGLIVQHWQPNAPADDPLQGFALAPVIDAWLADGPLVREEVLIPGLYPAQNAHTVYDGDWRFSALGADARIPAPGAAIDTIANRITIQFEGTALALLVRRDGYLAYLHITVDDAPANALPRNRQGDAFIVLTSPERTTSLDLIRVAEDLSPGVHTAEIVHLPSLGDDRWPIAGFAVGVPPDTTHYDNALRVCMAIGALALLGIVVMGWRLPWRTLSPPAPGTLAVAAQWLVSVFAAFVVLVAGLLTWSETLPTLLRRDQPALLITIVTAGIASLSPVFVVALVALLVLFVLIYNRPVLGVMLIIFWSAFFLSTLDLLFNAFATVEVYFGLTAVALAAHGIRIWARNRRDEDAGERMFSALRLNALDWLVIAFVLLAILSLAWSEYRGPAIRNLRVVVLEPAAFYFVVRVMYLERRDLFWLVDTLLFTGAAIAVVGLVLFFTGESVVEAENGARRLISVYGSPNGVGLYLGRCLPFALAYMLLAPRGSWRWLYAVLSGVVMLVAVLLSQSRGAILFGLPAALVMLLVFWRGRRAVLPVLVGLAGIVIVLVPLSLVLPRLTDLFGDTFAFRRHLWYSSVRLIEERPITGVGLDQFLYWYRSRYLLPEAWEEPNLSIPHNILLNFWVNLGVFGVLWLAVVQGWFWRALWRIRQVFSRDPLLFAILVGLAGSMADVLAHGLVDVGYFAINLAFVFFLLLALLQRLRALDPGEGDVV